MTKWLILIVVIVVIAVLYVRSVTKTFIVKFDIENISLDNLNVTSILNKSASIQTRICFDIFFSSFFNIIISNVKLNAYYKSRLIARSSNTIENSKRIVLLHDKNNVVCHTFDLITNLNTSELLLRIKTKQPYNINYNISINIFGIPITFNSTYTNK